MGLANVASLMDDYALGFRELGHEVFTAITSTNTVQSTNVDLNIPQLVEQKLKNNKNKTKELRQRYEEYYLNLAWGKALEADVCIFFWRSFKPDASDLLFLKKLGKKIIIRFCGSEVKDPFVSEQAAKLTGYHFVKKHLPSDIATFVHKIRYLRTCEKVADMVIGSPDMGLRPSYLPAAYIFDSTPFKYKKEQKKNPVLLHAPSNVESKGTYLWLNAFQILNNAGLKFSTRIVQWVPYSEMAREYAQADIFCNSLAIGGRSTWEAMAASCVVVEKTTKVFLKTCQSYFKDTMSGAGLEATDENYRVWLETTGLKVGVDQIDNVIHVTPETVAEELAKIILDYPKRQKLSKKSYELVQEMHPQKVCQKILDYLENPESIDSKMSTLWMSFFAKDFDPSGLPQEKIDLFNKYNGFVKYEKWYKAYVHPRINGKINF